MKNTSLILGCGALDVTSSSYRASDEHPMSTRSASDGGRWKIGGKQFAKVYKYVACLLLAFVLGIGQMWGADLEIPLTNLKNFPLDYGLVVITNTQNTTIGSNALTVKNNTAKFKVETKGPGIYLKSISFTDANSSKNGGFSCDENASYMVGPTENVYAYTAPNTTTTEANFTLVGSGGTAQIGTIKITVSTSNQVERLTAFGSISNQKIPFTSSAATTSIELSVPSSNGVSVSSSKIQIATSTKHLIVSTKNSEIIKYIAIPKFQQATYAISGTSTPSGTYADDGWTPSTSDVESVDLSLKATGSTTYSQEVYVVYSAAVSCTSNPTAPTGLSVGSITGSGATFTVTDAANTNNYEIVCKKTSGEPATDATPTQTGTSQTIAVTGLDGGTTYYAWVRSVCDADHKSSWVALGNGGTFATLTAITPTLSYANNPLILTVRTTGTPNLTGNTGSGTVTWNSSAEGVATVDESGNITAVAAGTTTITASIAANGGYAAGEAEVVVNVAAAPLGIIDQKLAVTNANTWDASVIVTSDYTNITSLTALAAKGGLSIDGGKGTTSSSTDLTAKVEAAGTTSKNGDEYLEFQFTIADGKRLHVTGLYALVRSVSNDRVYYATLTGTTGSIEKTTTVAESVGAGANIFDGETYDDYFTGTVSFKLWAYSTTSQSSNLWYRLGSNIYITGTIEDVPAPTTKKIYMKCGDGWCDAVSDGAPKFFVHSWGSELNNAAMTQMTGCETDVYYADIPAANTSLIFTRQKAASTELVWSGDNFVQQSEDITIGENDLFTCTSNSDTKSTFSGSTYAAPKYTISFNNGGGTGTMDAIENLACGANQAITANAFEKAGHSFANWTADVAVTIGGETVSAGSAIANQATIQNISSDIALTAQWTQEIPTSVLVDGTWRYFPGQTISLTATPTGGTSDFTYQWQQSNGSAWENIGTNSATYTKENCAVADARKYRCIVSKLGASVTSDEYKVHIYTLEGDYSGGSDWKVYNIAQTSGTVGTVAVDLDASSLFEFGIKDNYDNSWYRNTNFIVDNWTNEGFGQGSGNCRLFTGPEGYYTFTVDIAHVGDGTPYMEVSVAYPSVTHPVTGYAYFKKWNDWAGYYIHWWYNDGTDHPLTEWGSDVHITNETTICGTDYIYFPVIANYDQLKIKDAAGDASHYTGDLSSVGSSGKYFDFTNDNAWNTFETYTVTFNSNGGSEVAEQNVGCGETATEPADPTRLNYDFEGWQLAGVDYDFAAVVSDNITLDAVWTRKAISGSEADITLVGATLSASVSPLTSVLYYNKSYTSGEMSMAGGMGGDVSSRTDARYVGFTLPADHTATVYVKGKGSSNRKIAVVTEMDRATSNWEGAFLELTMTGTSNEISNTSSELSSGTYCVGSEGSGLTIMEVTVHVNIPAPSVKLKVNGEVTQTITISVGEKLGDIFASGSLPIVDLTGYTFNGWKNEVGDAAVDNNTVISGSMVIYADLTAHEYSVALENGETDGAATVHYGETALTITTAVSGEEGDELDGFYTAATEGTKVADADGTLVASITGYTDENGKWIKTSDATLYTIWIPYVPSSDATLSDLTIGGETVDGFDAATISYDVELPFGTTVAPTIAGTANDAKAKSVVVTQAASANGDATVVVTAEDNSTKTYTIHFSVVATKDIELVWATDKQRCDATTPSAVVKSNNAAVSTYINQITFTGGGEEGSSLNVGKNTGNMLTLAAKAGFAIKALSFYGKIESADTKLEYSLDGGSSWNDLASTSGDDACYSDVFTNEEVHTLCMRSAGSKGFWIRNMQLTMIQACTPKTIAWTTEPAAEYELGSSPAAIAASANNGTVSYASTDGDVLAVNESTGALTLKTLGTVTLSASVPAGDGVTYCDEGAQISKANIATYYLVTFNAQNGTPVSTTKYYKNDAAIALPATPSYAGFNFLGWFDAAEGGNEVTSAITPTTSRTIYAQWEAQCAGPTIETQPESASYFVGRTASALSCEATPGVEGKALTYTWYSCDDAERTNPVELAGAPTPSTAAVGTFYYYCAVTEEDCDVIRNSNVVTVSVTEKEMLLLIQANHVKGKTANMSGYIGGTYRKEMQDNSKLGSKGHYFGIKLASGTFQAGDRVYIHTTEGADTNGDYVRIFKSNEASAENVLVEGTEAMVSPNGDNWVTLPATTLDSLYLRRGTDAENYNKDWNPWIDIFAVYRPYPVPVLKAMTINGSEATIAGTNVTAVIASNAELASLDIDPTFMSNDPTQTNGALGDWTEVSEGVYTASYVVTDKDEDTNTYTITLTRDVEIASITISGETSVMEGSQITLIATVLPNNVINKAVVWTSSDETKAEVDENGVVTAKAAGAVTITATSVVDNTKYGTYDITVTGYIGTKRAYWFAYADDAAANSVSNNSTVFGDAPTGSTSGTKEITLEEGWVVNTTKKAGAPGSTGTFVVPAEYTATFYAVVKGSGSSGRYIQLKQGDVVKYTSDEFGSTDPTIVKIEGVVAGTYTINYDGGMSNFYLYAAELNRYAITSVTLESAFTLRTEDSRTPAMTLVHAKAAVASQTWSIVSSTATGTTINEETGLITAGTTPGTITVQVVVEDVMGNEEASNTCTVEIVEEFERIDVTGSMTWNWNELSMSNVNVSTDRGLALANYIDGEKWQMLNGANGDYAYRSEASGCYEALDASSSLSFHTTVPGMVKITGRRRSNDAVVKINGEITVGTVTQNLQTFAAVGVQAGEVTITPDANGMRITKVEFIAASELDAADADYTRTLNNGNIGTICLPKAGFMIGASVFSIAEMDYKDDQPYKIYFDEVPNGAMEAGKPYVFLPDENSPKLGVFYTSETQVDPDHDNGLYGYYSNDPEERYNVPKNDGNFIISNNKYWYVDDDVTYVPQNRAYIKLAEVPGYGGFTPPTTAAQGRRRISLGVGSQAPSTATGMDDVQGDDVQCIKVLIDGRIFILRGEKMYDVTGKLVK